MLILQTTPTFWAPVKLKVPGKDKPAEFEVEFVHKSKEEMHEYMFGAQAQDRSDFDSLKEVVRGWRKVDLEFSEDNLKSLLQKYHGAARALIEAYWVEHGNAKAGN